MSLQVSTNKQEPTAVVSVAGEVDVSNADELRSAIDEVISDGSHSTVCVDLAQVPYIDSTGIGVLVGAKSRATQSGVSLVVVNPQRNVSRVLSLLGVDKELGAC